MFDAFNKAVMTVAARFSRGKRKIAWSVDVLFCALTVWLALGWHFGHFVDLTGQRILVMAISMLLALPIFGTFGLYRAIFHYSGVSFTLIIVKAVGVYGVYYATILALLKLPEVPSTVGMVQPLLLFVALGGYRILARYWLERVYPPQPFVAGLPRALIYGAGNSGRQLASALHASGQMQVIGFMDDDERLRDLPKDGKPVFLPRDLSELIQAKGITHVLLALPSATRQRRNQIIRMISRYPVVARTLPTTHDPVEVAAGGVEPVELGHDDLLGRERIQFDSQLVTQNLAGKGVMLIGAGSSMGVALAREFMGLNPATLLLVDGHESAINTLHVELEGWQRANPLRFATRVVPIPAFAGDRAQMVEILTHWQPDRLFHVAAVPHQPFEHENLEEVLRNDLLVTMVLAEVAVGQGVGHFVRISIDPATEAPQALVGAGRLVEQALRARQGDPGMAGATRFSVVRIGAGLESSEWVIEALRRQIASNGPITLTHANGERQFLTRPEIARLVIQAAAMATGGDLFVLDAGKPVRVLDLARSMVALSGRTVRDDRNPDGDLEIAIIGLRPGEKLCEELHVGVNAQPTGHPHILRIQDSVVPWSRLAGELETLRGLLGRGEHAAAVEMLEEWAV
ncbi:MAG: polysaccharide biosynthesis protein [Magnetococcus sp. YQC-9]